MCTDEDAGAAGEDANEVAYIVVRKHCYITCSARLIR